MPAVDVAVIGGGIVGASTAAFLAEGGLRVRLYERTAIAAGASGRNSGIVQHPFDPVLASLYRASVAEYRALAAASAGAFVLGAEPAGLLYVGHDLDLARSTAREWLAAWPRTAPEVVAGPDLVRLEPALAPDLAACRLGVGYPVAPAAATEAFATLARRRGVEIALGTAVSPAAADGRITGVSVDGRHEAASAVVVAAGPWTPDVIDPSGAWRPIARSWGVVASVALARAPRHGLETIDITIEPDDDAEAPDIADEAEAPDIADEAVDFSLVPAAGSSALGSTFLAREPDPAAWVDALRRVGSRYVPGVADAALVGLRHCARPVSRDGRPLIGAVPGIERLWVAAGHGPWGISTGPGSARLLAERILGRIGDGGIPPELRADRFARHSA